MREKLSTLSVVELRELAKNQGKKGTGSMRKAELVEWLAGNWEKSVKEKAQKAAPAQEKPAAAPEKPAAPAPEKSVEEAKRPAPERRTAPAARRETVRRPAPAQPGRQELPQRQQRPASTPVLRQQEPVQRPASTPVVRQQEPVQRPTSTAVTWPAQSSHMAQLPEELKGAADSGPQASGILEVLQEGYGFIRSENYMSGDDDVYVSPSQIRRFNLKTGDIVTGVRRIKGEKEKYGALLYVNEINGVRAADAVKRPNFEDMTPIFPNERIHLAVPGASTAMRVVDLISPIGKGQRGMIVSPPKAGKTTLLKQIARVVTETMPDMHLIILLIDERPEEVTDIKEYIQGPQVEVIYSTFDREPEQHKRVSEMVIERARRLVEMHKDVMILLDSITRLARAYNLTVMPSGRTLSGGLDPAALYMPKRFFGAARNMREGGSLTILATALVDTGSRMDDVVYEEFKGTGNMELVLDRKLQEKRIFPAIDILKSGTRRDDLLLSKEEQEVLDMIHRMTNGARPEESAERILDRFAATQSNADLIRNARFMRHL